MPALYISLHTRLSAKGGSSPDIYIFNLMNLIMFEISLYTATCLQREDRDDRLENPVSPLVPAASQTVPIQPINLLCQSVSPDSQQKPNSVLFFLSMIRYD